MPSLRGNKIPMFLQATPTAPSVPTSGVPTPSPHIQQPAKKQPHSPHHLVHLAIGPDATNVRINSAEKSLLLLEKIPLVSLLQTLSQSGEELQMRRQIIQIIHHVIAINAAVFVSPQLHLEWGGVFGAGPPALQNTILESNMPILPPNRVSMLFGRV
jgi:hypothetical protein